MLTEMHGLNISNDSNKYNRYSIDLFDILVKQNQSIFALRNISNHLKYLSNSDNLYLLNSSLQPSQEWREKYTNEKNIIIFYWSEKISFLLVESIGMDGKALEAMESIFRF